MVGVQWEVVRRLGDDGPGHADPLGRGDAPRWIWGPLARHGTGALLKGAIVGARPGWPAI